MSEARDQGFTLLEVLLAVFVVGIVLGALISYTGSNLAALGDARRELTAFRLGEQKLREIETSLVGASAIRDRVDRGGFEADPDWAWEARIETVALALPQGFDDDPPSDIFGAPNGTSPVRRVTLRVYSQDTDPDEGEPLVVFLVEAPPQEEPP